MGNKKNTYFQNIKSIAVALLISCSEKVKAD
jgi:hypothetical protein